MRVRPAASLGLALLAGCSPQPGAAAPEQCAPVTEELPSGAAAEGLEGEYQLRMIATSGPQAGDTVVGRLLLVPHDSSMRRVTIAGKVRDRSTTVPLYGAAELDPASVGALYAGDLSSLDPGRPGVAVFESDAGPGGGPRILLRLGSEANRRDQLRFDGPYTVLRVKQISEEGFAGTWDSGAPLPRSGGHFCAKRSRAESPGQ